MGSSSCLPRILFLASCCLCVAAAQGSIPALYVLGDSQADAGTNNYLVTPLRADIAHNGVDYPGCKATGRFSNGKNFVDFLAGHLQLASPPPYMSICNTSSSQSISNTSSESIYLKGVNFASGGAGISSQTNEGLCISFDYQIDHQYSNVYASLVRQLGKEQASTHLGKSIFAVAIGGNDIINYVLLSLVNQLIRSPEELVASLALSLKGQLQRMYDHGMRKLFVVGAAPLGCCPLLRASAKKCNARANDLSAQYNIAVASLLNDMSARHSDLRYSLFDTATALLQYIRQPQANGYEVVDAACCGLGDKNGMFVCSPARSLCTNRTNHIFWDFVYPTEITAQKLTALAFDGSAPLVTPRNVRQLRDTAI